jgi:hypothetical protein
MLFKPSLMFEGEARGLLLSGAPEKCFTLVGPALPANIGLGWKRMPGTSTLAYYENS